MVNRDFKVRALGEIAIRCHNISEMKAFYRDVIGLEILASRNEGQIIFFKIAQGFSGHTAILALFDQKLDINDPTENKQNAVVSDKTSSLHHIALSLPFDEQHNVIKWYESLGISYTIQDFSWIGWRGIFTKDPQGNTVELVSYDLSIMTNKS